jgi:hypothetical protein
MNKNSSPLNGRRISEVFLNLTKNFSTEYISILELRDLLSSRVYGLFLLILSLPNCIPMPAPGLSAVTGFPLLLISVQMIFNVKTLWLPKSVLKRKIKKEQLQKVCNVLHPYLIRVEKIIHPRLFWLVKYPSDRLIAFICAILSLIIMLPIPFGNAIPAFAICLFSIAILQRDGFFVILGIIFSALGFAVAFGFIKAIIIGIFHFLGM